MAKRGNGEGTIAKRPDGTWWARVSVGYDDNGKQKRKAFYGKTRQEVAQKMIEAQNKVNNRVYIEPSKMTVAQWMDIWLKEYKKPVIRLSTYNSYVHKVNYYIVPNIGYLRLSQLKNKDVQGFANSLSQKGISSVYAKDIVNEILKPAMEKAIDNELILKNPVRNISFNKTEKKEIRVLSQEEQNRFVNIAKKAYLGEVFILLLGTGLRIGEALAITWEDIDFQNKTLRINKSVYCTKDPDDPSAKITPIITYPKTKAGIRTVPLIASMIELLKQVKKNQAERILWSGDKFINNNLVFCTRKGGLLRSSDMRQRLIPIAKEANIENLHIHCLRHTFATRGLEEGIELKVMQEFLGHANIEVTGNVYTHVLAEKKTQSIEKLEHTITL